MIDTNLAVAVKRMNQKVLIERIDYVDSSYQLAMKDFDIVVIKFENGQSFELNEKTFKSQFSSYKFRMKKGVG